jgi:hypothetical protein
MASEADGWLLVAPRTEGTRLHWLVRIQVNEWDPETRQPVQSVIEFGANKQWPDVKPAFAMALAASEWTEETVAVEKWKIIGLDGRYGHGLGLRLAQGGDRAAVTFEAGAPGGGWWWTDVDPSGGLFRHRSGPYRIPR